MTDQSSVVSIFLDCSQSLFFRKIYIAKIQRFVLGKDQHVKKQLIQGFQSHHELQK